MTFEHDRNLIALGVRQPWAELIVRNVKTIEVRSQPTNVRGPIYIYAAKKVSTIPDATIAWQNANIDLSELPLGRIIGQVDILDCRPTQLSDTASACVSEDVLENQYAWVLQNGSRLAEPMKPRFLPYGVWFYPFKRRSQE